MNIQITSLPSRGLTVPIDIVGSTIDLEPLTYKQLVKFTNSNPVNDIDLTIHQIDCLVKDIKYWNYLSAYDLSSIIFTRELLSASFKDSIVVSHNGKNYTVDLDDITFKDINEELLTLKSITLGNTEYPIKIPTIEDYYKTLQAIQANLDSKDFWLNKYDAMVLSALGMSSHNYYQMLSVYENATEDDVVTIKYVDRLLNNTVNDITKKGEGGDNSVINISKLITDIFQFIRHNRLLNTDKIKFKSEL